MAGLGTLPSSGSILGNSPGASGQQPRRRPQGAQSVQPGSQQPQAGQPQTFAQMQAQGQARPAPPTGPPPQAPHPMMQPQGSAMHAGPSSYPGVSTQPSPAAPPVQHPDVGSQLQQSVSNALASPSRYDLPQVQQVRDALTGQLQQQFGAQKKSLDEDMARRGLSASSIASGYNGDLLGQQDTALANMNANLIQNQAATSAADLSASVGAGQNYQSGQLASQLGLGNLGVAQQNANTAQTGTTGNLALGAGSLTGTYGGQQTLGGQAQDLSKTLGMGQLGLSQGALTGVYGGQQTLGAQEAAANNALGFGNLMGSVNGQATLGGQQLMQGGQQFQDQLAQQLGIATMADRTANRGVDANAALAQNDLMLKVAQFLAANGYSTTQTPTPTPTPTPDPKGPNLPPGPLGKTPPNPTDGPPPPETETGRGGQLSISPNRSLSASAAPLTTQSLFPNPSPTLDPLGGTGSGTTGRTLSARAPMTFGSYQMPRFGNSSYTGLFGNSPIQYGATSAGTTGSGSTFPGGDTLPPNGGGTATGPGGMGGATGGADPGSSGGSSLSQQIAGALGKPGPIVNGGIPGDQLYGNNLAHPGDKPQDTYGRNTTANPSTGAGPLSVGTSMSGTDPMSRYARGEIDYPTMQQAVQGQNAAGGGMGFTSDALQNYTSEDQLKQGIQAQYKSLLNANGGSTASARQAFMNPVGAGAPDPRVIALFNQMYGS